MDSHNGLLKDPGPVTVDLWLGQLEGHSQGRLDHYASLLSPAELEANRRFSRDNLRRQDILCRGMLRQLLAQYLAVPAQDIPLCRSAGGKPGIDDEAYSLKFNYSHSGDLVLFAFAEGVDLGVDIERVSGRRNALGIARSFFAPAEYEALLQLPPEQQLSAFYRYWTLKEAYLKARGEGISTGLAGFAFVLDPLQQSLIDITFPDGRSDHPQHWWFQTGEPAPGYRTGLAVRTAGAPCACGPVRSVV